jgi:pSer/pThr/pTyr-binding forkhead associated (FHA) protein/tetratricopeptide (TPR) repeat protein
VYTLVARDSTGTIVGSAELTQEPVSVGRQSGCGLVLPSTGVSRRHATFALQGDGSVLVNDEGSANGVKVDGQFITAPTIIDPSILVEISEFRLSVELDEAAEADSTKRRRKASPAPEAPREAPPARPKSGRKEKARRPALEPAPEAEDEDDEGAGAEPAHTPTPEPEEMYTVLEAQLDPKELAAARAAELQLVGRGGPYDGTVFAIDKPLLTVGRAADSDVVLEDPSISRRHAHIRLAATGAGFTVLDLRSSNGTFVDGKRVKRAECVEGSIVRFGDLPFRIVVKRKEKQAGAERTRAPGRRRLLLAAFSILLVLVTVGIVAKKLKPKPPPTVVVTPEERIRAMQAEIQRSIDEGRQHLTMKEWAVAAQALAVAEKKDPLNPEPKRLRAQALEELENQKTYEKGLEYFALGNTDNLVKAKEVFQKVPASSVYSREARYRIKAADERLADGFRVEGVSRCQAKYWEQCHEALCKFFELLPEEKVVTGETGIREMLQGVEKRLAKKKDFTACQAPRFLSAKGGGETSEDPEKLLAEKYEVAEAREVLLLYVQGKIDMAQKKLTALRADKSMHEHDAMLRELDRQLLIIRGKFQEGYSAFRDRNVVDAQREWDLVLAADKAIMPDKLESYYAREVTRSLGDLYFELGDEQYKLGRFRQAYEFWSQGKKALPKHDRIMNGLFQLEKEAEKLVRAGRKLAAEGSIAEARTKITLAKEITEEDRDIRKEVEKALGELGD